MRLYIEGYDWDKALQTTIDTVFTPNDSLQNLNAILSATTYPYLRLGVYYFDDQYLTPAQVDRLHVLLFPRPRSCN